MKSALQPFFPSSTEDGEVVIHHRTGTVQEGIHQRAERKHEAMLLALDFLRVGRLKEATDALELNLY